MSELQPKVCLAITSNHEKVDRDFMMHLVTLYRPGDTVVSLRGQHIKSASLNEHLAEASNNNCTHIFFMDVDMNFPPWTLMRLMSHKLPIVTGLYHLKASPFSPIMGWIDSKGVAINGNGRPWKDDYCPLPVNSLVEIHWCGIGCLLVDMDVFNKIWFPPFRDEWDMEQGKRHKGHDVIFCEEVRKAGYQIFADTSVDVTHVGRSYINRAYVETYHRLNMDQEIYNTVNAHSLEPAWWDEKWSQHLVSGRERSQKLLVSDLMERIPPKSTVIDMGCGDGQLLRILKQSHECDVFGMDFSDASIRILQDKGIPGEVVDLRTYTPNGRTASTVILSHVLEHMTDAHVGRVIQLVADMTTDQAFIVVPHDKQLWYEHCKVYDDDSLRAAVTPYFDSVEVFRVERDDKVPSLADYHIVAHCRKRDGHAVQQPVADEAMVAATG